jgi:hypothetical protein
MSPAAARILLLLLLAPLLLALAPDAEECAADSCDGGDAGGYPALL